MWMRVKGKPFCCVQWCWDVAESRAESKEQLDEELHLAAEEH